MSTPSPCIHVCRVGIDGHCSGCLRTLAEIANWATLSDTEKFQIIAELEKRKSTCPIKTRAV